MPADQSRTLDCWLSCGAPGFGNERAYVRVLIGQLRKKLEDDPADPIYILTDSYIGYRFREP